MIKNKKSGFSLLEFLFVMILFLIGLAIALQIFTTLNKNYRILTSYLTSYLKGREIIDIISKDCRVAIRVLDNYTGYTTTNDCLILKVPSIDASRNIIDVNNEFDHVIYRIYNGDLWKIVIAGGNSSRLPRNSVLKKSIPSLYVACKGVPLSGIPHKSSITQVTLRISIAEIILGKEYKVEPGTTVKLMNYEWEFVR